MCLRPCLLDRSEAPRIWELEAELIMLGTRLAKLRLPDKTLGA